MPHSQHVSCTPHDRTRVSDDILLSILAYLPADAKQRLRSVSSLFLREALSARYRRFRVAATFAYNEAQVAAMKHAVLAQLVRLRCALSTPSVRRHVSSDIFTVSRGLRRASASSVSIYLNRTRRARHRWTSRYVPRWPMSSRS
jgi:hypothetical protein